jgi:23S rRNA pseudouridine2605 synthase
LVLDPGYRVAPGDTVSLSGKKMTPQKDLVYVLLNKPKDFITTTDDPEDRKTVMDLVANAGVDRLYPVGRLDRKTTGLLLLTNDGALAHRLSHPSFNIRKVYHVTLDKNLAKADYDAIFKGVVLEDGPAPVDEIAYLESRKEVGVEIHNGRNRIVRRIFESLGYEVEKLDRVSYADLTKKNLPRGKWRFLDEKEIIYLKHFNSKKQQPE